MIAEEKKISFDKEYAEELWRNYNESKQVDDSNVVSEMKTVFSGKKVLLVGPGKTVASNKEKINELICKDDVISIGLNLTDDFDVDYLFASRQEVYDMAVEASKAIITTSNVSKGARGNIKVLNYKNWIEISDGRTHDSSSVIMLNLLKECDVEEILLAGFDGFAVNINENYSDPDLRRPVTVEQVERRNAYYKKFISNIASSGVKVEFVTPSKYE